MGARFLILVFSGTLLGALLGAYQYVLVNRTPLGDWVPVALRAIPLFGMTISIALILIEIRTQSLYKSCVKRAKEIEVLLSVGEGGHFHLLDKAPRYLRVASHTIGIFLIYGAVLAAWTYLFVKALHP